MSIERVPWRELLEVAPVAISVVDPYGRQVACNRAYTDLLGYQPGELDDSDIGQVTRPTDRNWTRAYLTQLVSGEIEEFATEKVYVRKDGSELTARLTARALRDESGACSFLLATIVPVERPVSVSVDRTRRLLEFTTDTLTVLDIDGNVLETTGRHAPVLGYPPEFWNTRTAFDLVVDDDVARIVELRDRLLSDPATPVEAQIDVRAADGSIETLQVTATNRLADPDVAGIVVTTRNVTELLRTLAELSRSRETAEAVADAQTRLLATVSHELRNPLHAVQGLAELLSDEELPPAPAALAETLRRQLASLTQVTQDLLDAARLDAGEVQIAPRPTRLRSLVDDVVAVGSAAAAGRPLEISSRTSSDVPEWVLVDADRLRQILVNLVGNAVKFTPRGTVELVAGIEPDGVMSFDVVDTGVGIPSDELDTVLEPFRVASTGGGQRGAGLGLSIVQRLVAALGGRVRVTSQVDTGTRVRVLLPLDEAQPPDAVLSEAPISGLSVLVVEDNPVNQQLARSQLERLGLVPTIVATGEAALELLDGDAQIDLILMDHQLPGISGLETTRRVRERTDRRADVAIIGLSASASAADADAFIAAGMDDFVAKPASLHDLSTAIVRAQEIDRLRPPAAVPRDDHAVGSSGPDVDTDVIELLVADLGDRDLVVGLIETFLDELDHRVVAIVERSGDGDAARRAAHTLKSSARLLGAVNLADACSAIERGEPIEIDVAELAAAARAGMQSWIRSQRVD